jgi:hypothetical protein
MQQHLPFARSAFALAAAKHSCHKPEQEGSLQPITQRQCCTVSLCQHLPIATSSCCCCCCRIRCALQAAGVEIHADTAWTIFAPTNEAFSDDDIRDETGLTAQQLLQPENRQALTQVGQQHVIDFWCPFMPAKRNC